MPFKAPRICGCGRSVPWDVQCVCQKQRERERNVRYEANRPSARERGYTTKWDRERTAYLKAHPHCAMCGQAATVVDHKIPHRGDRSLFWSRSNWQPLCTSCHSSRKQRIERRAAQ
jgi:5-methylcytosine-specific restriction endonuclease McrA